MSERPPYPRRDSDRFESALCPACGSVVSARPVTDGKVLSIEDLTVEYAGRPSVKGISFDIPVGHIVGLVGESGAGKSTVLRAAVRLLPEAADITGGRIILFGRDAAKEHATSTGCTSSGEDGSHDGQAIHDGCDLLSCTDEELVLIRGSKVATIFQNPGSYLDPSMRIGRQIVEVLRIHTGVSKGEAHERAVDLLSKMGLPQPESIFKSYPFELSGGMQQRVSIALAMAFEPVLLLADEPTSALDTTTQLAIMRELKRLNVSSGTSILLVTHNIGLAYHLCDDIVVMQSGAIVEHGTAGNVINDPQAELTRKLIAAVPQVL